MPRYQVLSQRASGESAPPSGWVSAGTSKLASLPASTPKTATAIRATASTSARLAANATPAERRDSEPLRRAIACAPMTIDLPIAGSFWADQRNVITAVLTIVGAFVLAVLVDRGISHRGAKLANAMP